MFSVFWKNRDVICRDTQFNYDNLFFLLSQLVLLITELAIIFSYDICKKIIIALYGRPNLG